jgi:hypothetical protein
VINGTFDQELQNCVIVDFLGFLFGEIGEDFGDDLESRFDDPRVQFINGDKLQVELFFANFEALIDGDVDISDGVVEDGHHGLE